MVLIVSGQDRSENAKLQFLFFYIKRIVLETDFQALMGYVLQK